ncbi:hypothetical protein [Actinoplanes regularis]|uniref:hypothetical protein n=1 Tax=Actinoplanes regularis TaxID=52697 RepID=UPI0024A566DA|nr:hypothetical protein [Actinoplanes regularis]GLW29415.1 hypothetical protein Areg01_23550 [Actinoplanes regularis]
MGDFKVKIIPKPGSAVPSVLGVLFLVVFAILRPHEAAEVFKTLISTIFDMAVTVVKAIFGVD